MLMGWIAALALGALLWRPASAGNVDVELRFWFPDLSGDAQASDGAAGTVIDLESDLGMSSDMTIEPRVNWQVSPRNRLSFMYANIGAGGDQMVARDLTFLGTTYTAATRVVSDIDVDLFRLEWGYNWVNQENWSLESVLNVGAGTGDAVLMAPGTALPTQSESVAFPYVTIGLGVEVRPIEQVSLFGQFDGLPFGDWGHIWNGEIGARWMPSEHFGIVTGYRLLDILAKDDSAGDRVDIDADGWFFGANGTF